MISGVGAWYGTVGGRDYRSFEADGWFGIQTDERGFEEAIRNRPRLDEAGVAPSDVRCKAASRLGNF